METVSFTRMEDGTPEDYALLERFEETYTAGLADRVLGALRGLEGAYGGYQISRLGHSLQTAALAEADGADDEMIMSALLHDIGDTLAPYDHGGFAASILKPYVRPECVWVVRMHPLFQLHHVPHRPDTVRNARERYKGHEHFEACVNFCARWDQAAFDPAGPLPPLEHFEPLVRGIFARTPFDPEFVGEKEADDADWVKT